MSSVSSFRQINLLFYWVFDSKIYKSILIILINGTNKSAHMVWE